MSTSCSHTQEIHEKLENLKDKLHSIIAKDETDKFEPVLIEFLSHGGDIDFENGYLVTITCRTANLKILDILSKRGANMKLREKENLSTAANMENYDILEFLLEKGANSDLLLDSIAYKRTPEVKQCVDKHLNKKNLQIKTLEEEKVPEERSCEEIRLPENKVEKCKSALMPSTTTEDKEEVKSTQDQVLRTMSASPTKLSKKSEPFLMKPSTTSTQIIRPSQSLNFSEGYGMMGHKVLDETNKYKALT